LATPNYGYEKRQKELAKKRKKEEKQKSKTERKQGSDGAELPSDGSSDAPPVAGGENSGAVQA
jgi:hypothetical protein